MGYLELSWIIRVGRHNHNNLYKTDSRGVRARRDADVMKEAEIIRVMHFEDGGRGHKPRNTGGHWKLKKARKQIFPSKAPGGICPANTLTLAQQN